MKKEIEGYTSADSRGHILESFPEAVVRSLLRVAGRREYSLYLVGGTVRDWLLGRQPHDLDLTIASGAEPFCRDLVKELPGATYVQLGTAEEEAARVVWQGLEIDVSSFRRGAESIEEDLQLRDFTINSVAIHCKDESDTGVVIDPCGGLEHLQQKVLHHDEAAFTHDPLRLVRAFRFMASLGFTLAPGTEAMIGHNAHLLRMVAPERISYEMELLLAADESGPAVVKMHELGLLHEIIPELYAGLGVNQPDFHHLDVFHHSLQAFLEMEKLLKEPDFGYPGTDESFVDFLQSAGVTANLKWAALLHDIGKPGEKRLAADGKKVTFYGHDETGRRMCEEIARRLRWGKKSSKMISALVGMHMHPFHLSNVRKEQGLSRRAALKLCKRAGDNLPGLFLLAMADSRASLGELKPADMEDQLVALQREVQLIYTEHIQPVLSGPTLLSGFDLIEQLELKPGPLFAKILGEVEQLQVEGTLATREEALIWARRNYGPQTSAKRDIQEN